VHAFGGALMILQHLGDTSEAIIANVIAAPEHYLRASSTAVIVLNSAALWGLGWGVWRAFGNLVPALALQLAPFMSSLVLKHGYLPKPEGLLVFSTLMFLLLSAQALRTKADSPREKWLAIAFGIAAGFGVATKLTVAPIYLLPVVLFGRWRLIGIYAISGAGALLFFLLPLAGAFEEILQYFAQIAQSSGAYGSGPQNFINLDLYPERVVKLLKRPALKIPLILALLTFLVAYFRRSRISEATRPETRALVAVFASQMAQVLFIAKQPASFYLIPSYMLSALTVLLTFRILWALRPTRWNFRISGGQLALTLILIFSVAQIFSITKRGNELKQTHQTAEAFDERPFSRCTRIYNYAASAPVAALLLADKLSGHRFSKQLAVQYPGNIYWIDDWYTYLTPTLRNWAGEQSFDDVRTSSQCILFRGHRPNGIDGYLRKTAPDLKYDATCSAPPENIYVVGADCNGNPK